jgi:hypothetical protein
MLPDQISGSRSLTVTALSDLLANFMIVIATVFFLNDSAPAE